MQNLPDTGRLGASPTPSPSYTDHAAEPSEPDAGDATETSSPASDPTEESFKAVSAGDCLEVYDTGRGGDRIDWSADVPPAPVPCHIQAAGLVQVTSTTDTTCPTGAGKASWAYTSDVSGETSKLCVTRIYHKYYCVLGKRVGDKTLLGSMTAVDCKAQRIPAAYNRIIHITGVYQAPPNASTRNCAQGPNDQTQYLAWLVDDDKLLLCAKIYQGG
ncbi:hypothetical protein [Streptomyces sp. NPDC059479]|uniref:hypothetical protein n=1 Tax=Streptomyces sp. NPDC059479 TaxID=3346848 RepID=UPI00368FBBF1